MAYLNENQQRMTRLAGEISKVIKGKSEAVQLILTALLAQGHVLIEDVPGVGKTTLAMALGKATGLEFRRAQFTPDVMASDITGFTMFNREENRFEYRAGLVMTNILLADEINRTSPKTQSALLEAMEEKRVTDIVCTKCRRMLRKKIRWFSSGQRYYLCLATCPEHGMMKGKIRMKKSEDGRVFAVKTVKPVDEEGAEAVFLKKEEARIRRAEKSRQKKLHGVE